MPSGSAVGGSDAVCSRALREEAAAGALGCLAALLSVTTLPERPLDQVALDQAGPVGGFFALRARGAAPRHVDGATGARVRGPRGGERGPPIPCREGRGPARGTRGADRRVRGPTRARRPPLVGGPWLRGTARVVPGVAPGRPRWDADGASPDHLWLTGGTVPGVPADADAAPLRTAVQDGHPAPLADSLRTHYRVSARLLRGNAGSALAGGPRTRHRVTEIGPPRGVRPRPRALALSPPACSRTPTSGTQAPLRAPPSAAAPAACATAARTAACAGTAASATARHGAPPRKPLPQGADPDKKSAGPTRWSGATTRERAPPGGSWEGLKSAGTSRVVNAACIGRT